MPTLNSYDVPITQRGAVNGVATLDGSGLVPVAQLPTSTSPIVRDTVGAPVIVTGDQAGDYAFDAGSTTLYGPLVVIGVIVNGHSWNTSLECSAVITPLATITQQQAFMISGWKAECFPRALALIDQVTLVSGTVVSAWVWLPKGTVVSNMSFCTGSVGATGPTHQWMRLCDASRVQLAVTADAGTGAIGTFTTFTKAVATVAAGSASSFTTTYSGLHLVELVVVCTGTPPKLYGLPSNPPMNQAPGLGGTTDTGVTVGPPSFPHTSATLTFIGAPLPYLGVS